MTERPRGAVRLERDNFIIGQSRLSRDGDDLVIDIDEPTVPIPSRLKGKIRLAPAFFNERVFEIEAGGRHCWRPIAPAARVGVEFTEPQFGWAGEGYFDSNFGAEPLEKRFRRWDWARITGPDGNADIVYDAETFDGERTSLSIGFDRRGKMTSSPFPAPGALPSTAIWRMPRSLGWRGGPPRIIKTLEDTPFYSRSVIEIDNGGKSGRGVHESFSGERLRSPIVKTMLGFRMLRLAR